MEFYADAEGGTRMPNPTRADLIGLIDELNEIDNTFIVVHPDPDAAERDKSTAAVPNTIADDVLGWISRR